MATTIDAVRVKGWLSEPREIAFLDVREAGQFGEGHPFFAVPLPYSVFELRLGFLVPNPHVRLVLIDGGDGVAERAGRRARALGYDDVYVVRDGVNGWRDAGFTLFAGVNLPSKTFGELVELQRHTPRITADELQQMKARGERHVIVDGRPFAEFQKMCIPGGICCPNGELALRIDDLAADPGLAIIVNCAGRTRSIIGAETLRALGLPNRVVALENGTQGWFLAGYELERGAGRHYLEGEAGGPEAIAPDAMVGRVARVREVARVCGVGFAGVKDLALWLGQQERTTYLFDVRSPEEHAARSVPEAVSAPGGQLIQATDQWVGVKGARLVLVDDDGVRAPMVGYWLAQLGHEVFVLEGGVEAAASLPTKARSTKAGTVRTGAAGAKSVRVIPAGEAKAALAAGVSLIDLRSSGEFRAGHIAGAVWSIRPRVGQVAPSDARGQILLVGPQAEVALTAVDLLEAGWKDVCWLEGGPEEWALEGLRQETRSVSPPDRERIDFLFFVHDRHEGNAEAARQYLAWEMGLLAQLDAQERGVFRVAPAPS